MGEVSTANAESGWSGGPPGRCRRKAPHIATAAQHAAQCRLAAAREHLKQLTELAAAELGPVSFPCELQHRAADKSAADLPRDALGLKGNRAWLLVDQASPDLTCGPVKRGIGFGEIPCAKGEGLRIEPVRVGERAADPNTLELFIGIAWIGHRGHSRRCAHLLELRVAPAEQRTHERDCPSGNPCD